MPCREPLRQHRPVSPLHFTPVEPVVVVKYPDRANNEVSGAPAGITAPGFNYGDPFIGVRSLVEPVVMSKRDRGLVGLALPAL